MSSGRADPFNALKAEVEASVSKVQFMHREWKRQSEKRNGGSQQFRDLHSEIEGELKVLAYSLQDVENSIQKVEQDRRGSNLSDADLERRRAFLNRCRAARAEVEQDLRSQSTARVEDDKRQALLSGGSGRATHQGQRRPEATDALLEQEQRLHRQLVDQQEDELAELAKATQRMGHCAQTINGELKAQQEMLDELNDDMEAEVENMGALFRGLNGVLKQSNKQQMCGLCGLTSLLFVLVFLIFTT